MKKPEMIGIIGLGLIGGSLGLALKKHLSGIRITGLDKNDEHLDYALEQGMVDQALSSENISRQEVIFIAVPVRSVIPVISELLPELGPETIITDTASTKGYLSREIGLRFPGLNYIGGHPLAGREVSGPRGAQADLFRDRKYILTYRKDTGDPGSFTVLEELLQQIRARVVHLPPEEHDRLLAFTSHLPQLVATLLCEQLQLMEGDDFTEIAASELVGQGFLDMTRIAASDPAMWLDIFQTNREELLDCSEELIGRIERFQRLLHRGNEGELKRLFNRGREQRLQLEGMKTTYREMKSDGIED